MHRSSFTSLQYISSIYVRLLARTDYIVLLCWAEEPRSAEPQPAEGFRSAVYQHITEHLRYTTYCRQAGYLTVVFKYCISGVSLYLSLSLSRSLFICRSCFISQWTMLILPCRTSTVSPPKLLPSITSSLALILQDEATLQRSPRRLKCVYCNCFYIWAVYINQTVDGLVRRCNLFIP